MVKKKKGNVYGLTSFKHIGDMQEVPFSAVKKESALRSLVSHIAKRDLVTLSCVKSNDHFKVIRKF